MLIITAKRILGQEAALRRRIVSRSQVDQPGRIGHFPGKAVAAVPATNMAQFYAVGLVAFRQGNCSGTIDKLTHAA